MLSVHAVVKALTNFVCLSAVAGNQHPELHFETLSGRLTVRQPAATSKPFLQMTLPNCAPSAAPDWLQQASKPLQVTVSFTCMQDKFETHMARCINTMCYLLNFSPTLSACCAAHTDPFVNMAFPARMQAALGISEVQEILIHPGLKYVLVVLPQGTSQEQLQSLQPDLVQLKAVATGEQIVGVIITCAGQRVTHDDMSHR